MSTIKYTRRNNKREANSYHGAKQRCEYKRHIAYDRYGGRGIQFRFSNFQVFMEYMGERPSGMTLERIDNDGHYEPGNVRWATTSEQSTNKKNNHYVTVDGVTLPFTQMARKYGFTNAAVLYRLRKGFSIQKAFTMPKTRGNQRLKH